MSGRVKRTPVVNRGEKILFVDPGNEQSGWIVMDRSFTIHEFGKQPNIELAKKVKSNPWRASRLVIETPQPRGQTLTWQLIHTAIWIGRFAEIWGTDGWVEADRQQVKRHLLGRVAGTDSQIRSALVEMWGGKDEAIGKKPKNTTDPNRPGPLYGITKDTWQALALAVTYLEGGVTAIKRKTLKGAGRKRKAVE